MPKKNYKLEQKIRPDWKRTDPKPAERPTGQQARVRLSFEYAQESHCLSKVKSEDVRVAIDCFRRFCSMTWAQVYSTATKQPGQKTGLHWHGYENHALKVERPEKVSDDLAIHGIRAGDKYRIFGFRLEDTFHVLWFDPEHTICPD